MNSFDSPAGMRDTVAYLEKRIAQLRKDIALLRLGPPTVERRRALRAWRFAAMALWCVGAASIFVLAVALFTFFRVAVGGIKG